MVGLAMVVAMFFVIGGCGVWFRFGFCFFFFFLFFWVCEYGFGSIGGGCYAVGEGCDCYAIVVYLFIVMRLIFGLIWHLGHNIIFFFFVGPQIGP